MGILHNLTGWHAIILFAVVLLFFGASKLPGLAKSVGQSVKILKSEVKDGADHSGPRTADDPGAGTGTTAHPPTAIHAVAAPREHASGADIR
jgi:sec-independent protein translocase protein TatA